MTEEMLVKLRSDRRFDMIDIYYLNQSGYAGVLSNGNIVDRREYPEAHAIPENRMFNVVKSRSLEKAYESVPKVIFMALKMIRNHDTYTGTRLLSERIYTNAENVEGVDVEINGCKTFLSMDVARDIDLENGTGRNEIVQTFVINSTRNDG